MSPRTPSPIRRRFSISDGMILVAASAVAAWLVNAYWPGFVRAMAFAQQQMRGERGLWVIRLFSWLYGPISCVAVPMMAALVALRFEPPRPSIRRLARGPGFAAGMAGIASLLPGLAWFAAVRHRPGFRRPDAFEQVWLLITSWTAASVAGAWLALILMRRWRAEPHWIDRLGRLLGAYWLVVLIGPFLLPWLQKLVSWMS